MGDCKSLKIKNARQTHITNEKYMKGLVGCPLLVGGREPGPPAPTLKSGPGNSIVELRCSGRCELNRRQSKACSAPLVQTGERKETHCLTLTFDLRP